MKIGRVGAEDCKVSLGGIRWPRQGYRANLAPEFPAERESVVKRSSSQRFGIGGISSVVAHNEATAAPKLACFPVMRVQRSCERGKIARHARHGSDMIQRCREWQHANRAYAPEGRFQASNAAAGCGYTYAASRIRTERAISEARGERRAGTTT